MTQDLDQNLPRAFKGIWIPREIWLHKELGYFEKMLWAEIDSLDHPENGCTASNDYLQNFFGCQERFLQLGLAKLKNLGFIRYESFNGRTRVIRSCLKTTYEKFDTSEVNSSSPLGCQSVHPSPIYKSKEENNVCPVGSRGVRRPGVFEKTKSDGTPIKVDESEIFRLAISKNPDWKTEEIQDAIDILWKTNGPVNSIDGFISGTIKKNRLKINFNSMEKDKWIKKQSDQKRTGLPREDESLPPKRSGKILDQEALRLLFPGC